MGLSLIEEAYFQAWGKAGGSGRVRRAFSMSAEIWRMVAFRIRQEHSGISDEEITWRAAKRMYFSDSGAQRLLDSFKGRVMSVEPDFVETTARIVRILSDFGVKFHLTGGVVAAYYGDPRSTQDLDIVVELSVNRAETTELLARLDQSYEVTKVVAINAIEQKGLFQAIDKLSMIKIDFHVGEKIPGELGRSTRRELVPGLVAPLVCKEDAILSKLVWIQLGSGRSRHDVTEMLRRDEDFDRASLKERAATLGLEDLLEEMESEMRAGPRLA
jgi:hypothetical protein